MSDEREFFCADYSCIVTELPCPHCGADEYEVVDL